MPQANYDISLEEQASFLMQSFALALSAGAKRVAVYKWLDNDLAPGFEPFGVVRPDYSRRPAYDAFRVIRRYYAGTIGGREDRQPLYTVVTLDQGMRTARVMWARTEAPVTLSLPALAPEGLWIDQTGDVQHVVPTDKYTVQLPGARCADKRGCIIGGPTYVLVENAPASAIGPAEPAATAEPSVSATEAVSEVVVVPTATLTPTVTETPTPTSTAPLTFTVTVTPTVVLTPTATETLTPTETPSTTSTPLPEPTATITIPSPTAAPQVTAAAGTGSVAASASEPGLLSWAVVALLGLCSLGGLAGAMVLSRPRAH
jgi:hypothetical protein